MRRKIWRLPTVLVALLIAVSSVAVAVVIVTSNVETKDFQVVDPNYGIILAPVDAPDSVTVGQLWNATISANSTCVCNATIYFQFVNLPLVPPGSAWFNYTAWSGKYGVWAMENVQLTNWTQGFTNLTWPPGAHDPGQGSYWTSVNVRFVGSGNRDVYDYSGLDGILSVAFDQHCKASLNVWIVGTIE